MKTHIKNPFPLHALIAGLGLLLAGPLTAQTFTVLHSFTGGSDGANPFEYGGLILSGTTLYGTAANGGIGGSGGAGTVFKLNTNGTGFTALYSFTAVDSTYYANSDGAKPWAGLILSGNTLYGTGNNGGTAGVGTVFKLNTNGTGFTVLHDFTGGSDGSGPNDLVLSGNTLYGTAVGGGTSGNGTVFALNTDGTGFRNLYSFTAGSGTFWPITNIDGVNPQGNLLLSGNTLYGKAVNGGSSGNGTLFAVNTDGTGFTVLHDFTGGSDGARPGMSLILSSNTLYGTTYRGGSGGANGTLFKLNTDGTGFTVLHSFTALNNSTNIDGHGPNDLVLFGNTLYGTAGGGGSSGAGTVFAVNTDGTGFTVLHNFASGSDGTFSVGGLMLSGNTLYGTAAYGGSHGNGTVFSLSLLSVNTPPLSIIPSGAKVILTWPTTATGFTLQSTTNLGSSAVWTTNSPAPVVVNGQNTVTNPISGAQQFFRLSL